MRNDIMEHGQEQGKEAAKSDGGRSRIKQRIAQNPKAIVALAVVIALAAVGGIVYWAVLQGSVYIEKAEISAPIISLAPPSPGVIDKFYVKEGDKVRKNQVLAKIGDGEIKAWTSGIIVGLKDTPGQLAGTQDAVVKMIASKDMRLIGRLEEDKGLADIRPGQRVIFTVDAFGSREYEGVVDSIAPSARESDIVFSISDKRQEREFNVKARFDVDSYPELKNGMSAKMWVYK